MFTTLTRADANVVQAHSQSNSTHPWWQVMCLTGVDYFSTLGYQPGIAVLAAGTLAPIATLVLVAVTLLFALPVYRLVAEKSPNGLGSIRMLEKLLSGWKGKATVLCLLGFAATDFIITITMSAADATAHIAENPFARELLSNHREGVTNALLILLGVIFIKGFKEVIALSVLLVSSYLLLTGVVISVGMWEIVTHPHLLTDWSGALFAEHGTVGSMILLSVLVFPRMALGLSGFETGVGVMPQVAGYETDLQAQPIGRIANTRKLLVCAAVIMAVYLTGSSLVTTLLVPAEAMATGGEASGRALAYLAHHYLGTTFGTMLDVSTVLILWFAGASALAGLINLVPRYLPRLGMAPEWTRASRPLIVFFTLTALSVSTIFNADVDSQASAYATGVLVLITSASLAAVISVWESGSRSKRLFFILATTVFLYTTLTNMCERPEGLKVASFFIAAIFITSLASRVMRATELRIHQVAFDATAQQFVKEAMQHGRIRLLANKPGHNGYAHKRTDMCDAHSLEDPSELLFLEVTVSDASDFHNDVLYVKGTENGNLKILSCASPAVPNAIARLLLHLRDQTNIKPDIYFGWSESGALLNALRYIFLGDGETGSLTRYILRQEEPKPTRRPRVHIV